MRGAASEWFARHTHAHTDVDLPALLEAKRAQGLIISVVIPARNEELGVGEVVGQVKATLVDAVRLVDEIVVIDSDSTDRTAAVARSAGAVVHAAGDILPAVGRHPGKGEALWKSLFVTSGDVLVFVDADLTLWGPHFVTGLLGPLLLDPAVLLVKGYYDRLLTPDAPGEAPTTEGGRVTELVARPLLNLWWPELAAVIQPLAGEWAARRTLMTSLPVPTGYGVEIATLIDTYTRHGLDAIAQVDLGRRAHHHQKDHDLAVMAAEILAVARERLPEQPHPGATDPTLHQFVRGGPRGGGWRERPVPLTHRPPADTITRSAIEATRPLRSGGAPC